MLTSKCRLSNSDPLGATRVAAYFFTKLKKTQVTETDISSSVDEILRNEPDAVTYRVLAHLLLGVVRIYSKKVDYLFDECHKALIKINEFRVNDSNAKDKKAKTSRSPYFSITLPERFELDAFDLDIPEDFGGDNVVPHEDITLKDGAWKNNEMGLYLLDKFNFDKFSACHDLCFSDCSPPEDVRFSQIMRIALEARASCEAGGLEASMEQIGGTMSLQQDDENLETFCEGEDEPPDPVKSSGKDHQTYGEQIETSERLQSGNKMKEKLVDVRFSPEECMSLETFYMVEEAALGGNLFGSDNEIHVGKVVDTAQAENEICEIMREDLNLSNWRESVEKLQNVIFQGESSEFEMFDADEVDSPEIIRQCSEEHDIGLEPMKLPSMSLSENENCQVNMDEPALSTQNAAHAAEEELSITVIRFGEGRHIDIDLNKLPSITSSENENFQVEDETVSVTSTVAQPNISQLSEATTLELRVIPTPATGDQTLKKRKIRFDDTTVLSSRFIKKNLRDSSALISKRKKVPNTALAFWRANRGSIISKFSEPLLPYGSLELRSLFTKEGLKVFESVAIVETPPEIDVVESIATESLNQTEMAPKTIVQQLSLEQTESIPETPCQQLSYEEIDHDPESSAQELPSVDQTELAHETPFHQSSLSISLESPKDDFFDTARSENSVEISEDVLSLSKADELDLSLMSTETSSIDNDENQQHRLSGRTRTVANYLEKAFLNRRKTQEEEVVNLLQVSEGRTRKESSRIFYEILVLKSKGYVDVKQENAYGDILVRKACEWDEACDSMEMTCRV